MALHFTKNSTGVHLEPVTEFPVTTGGTMPKENKVIVVTLGENFTWRNDAEARATLFLLSRHQQQESSAHSPEIQQGQMRIDFKESKDGEWKSSIVQQ